MTENQREGSSLFRNIKFIIYGLIGVFILYSVVFGDSEDKEYVTEEVLEPNQGIVTEVKEIKEDLFKIVDEEVVPTIEESRIIAEYLDGVRDTFTLDEAQLIEANDSKRSLLRSVVFAGAMGYMLGRPLGAPVSRSAYADDKTFNKSNSNADQLKSTAKRTTVSRPKSGFGSGKSTRSYGG